MSQNQSQSQRQSPTPPPRPPPPLPPSAAAASKCQNCGSEEKWILHHFRSKGGLQRRHCTTCVLTLHPSSFCPLCFHLHDETDTLPKPFTCTKCSSLTHAHCLSPSAAAAADTTTFVCTPCHTPSYYHARPLDGTRHALLVLCAARISADSMAKALLLARAEAERKLGEAAVARKRARDAIDNLALVAAASDHRPPVIS